MVAVDVLKYAVECINAVKEKYGKKGGVASKFRSRVREFAESLYYTDLTFLLTYIASKSGEKYLVGELIQKDPMKIVEEIKKMEGGEEEKSYGIYGVFLSKYIHSLDVFEKSTINERLGDFLLKTREKSFILTPYVIELGIWLKRLGEAVLEAE